MGVWGMGPPKGGPGGWIPPKGGPKGGPGGWIPPVGGLGGMEFPPERGFQGVVPLGKYCPIRG